MKKVQHYGLALYFFLLVIITFFTMWNFLKVKNFNEERKVYIQNSLKCIEEKPTRNDTIRAMAMAFALQESKLTDSAVSPCGKYVGCLQISKIMTREANRILKSDIFTPDSRYNKQDSFFIFRTVMEFHNPELNIDRAVDIWNVHCPDVYRNNVKTNYSVLLEDIDKANYFEL